MEVKDAVMAISDIYSMFTNNGYIADSESPLGFRGDNQGIPQRMVMQDLLTLPDMTRFKI